MDPSELKICSDPSTLEALRMILIGGIAIAVAALWLDGWRFRMPPLPPTGRPGLWCHKHRCPIGACISQHENGESRDADDDEAGKSNSQ